jgi:hypothetical protein
MVLMTACHIWISKVLDFAHHSVLKDIEIEPNFSNNGPSPSSEEKKTKTGKIQSVEG